MGCNLSQDVDITIFGNDVLVPLEDKEKRNSSVIKIDLKQGKYEIIRGFYGKLYKSSLSRDGDINTLSEEKIEL